MVADAKKEMQERKEAFDVAMSQAGRNLILSVKNETIGVCDYILKRQVASTLTPEAMKELILKIVNGWQVHESVEGLEILFSENDRQKLEESLYGWLQKELLRRAKVFRHVPYRRRKRTTSNHESMSKQKRSP